MISCEDALQFFRLANVTERNDFKKAELQSSIDVLQKFALEDGLSEGQMDEIVRFMTGKKISTQTSINLLNILIPETTVSKYCMEEILLWFFTKIGNENISNALGKKCIQWLTGVTFYELADTSVIDSYYYSLIFLLNKPFLESSVCRLLCLICKPEDANRWVVRQILNISNNSYPKSHANALLSLLKSYNPSVVPESISATSFHYQTTPFDEMLKKAHDRKLKSVVQTQNSSLTSNQWNTLKMFDGKSQRLSRLIPFPRYITNETTHTGKKLKSLFDFKTVSSLGILPLNIEAPAEILSLLANVPGYHVLAFSDFVIKARFFHKLYHTLCRVFLLELEPYSRQEKIFFLNSIMGLQEYTQQSIPVVTKFLFYYIPIWNGYDCREQVLGLLEWAEVCDTDLEKYIFPSLKQIFLSSGTHCRSLIINTLRKLMRNMLIMDKREHDCFRSEFQNFSAIKSIEAISEFGSELISIGLIWNPEETTRTILTCALDFYETSQAVEQAGDLPMIMVMPPALVYNCLFSGSRVCLARLCSLLVRLLEVSVERLFLLGVFEDYAAEVEKLNIYILDCFRCFWSKFNFQEEKGSFIFQHDSFCNKYLKLKETHGNVVNKIFGIEYNSLFWDPKAKGSYEVVLCQLTEDYPSIVRLKQLTEERFHQEF